MNILTGEKVVLPFIAGSGGTVEGEMVVISSGKVIEIGPAATAATIVGIALETKDEDAVVLVDVIGEGTIISAPYTGSSKTSVADTDFGTLFDLDDGTTVDLDDTTDGVALCVGYDNDVDEIKFVITAADRYL